MENTKPSKLKVLYVSNRHDTFYGVGHLSPRRYLEVLASLDLPDNFCCATAAPRRETYFHLVIQVFLSEIRKGF